jgi:hypothetical protein
MLCLHFGPGRLGLGLVVEQLLKASFDVYLVGPPGREPEEQRQFGLSVIDPEVGLWYPEVRWAGNPCTFETLPAEVHDAVADTQPLLLTAALGDAVADAAPLISSIVERRPLHAETTLLACENDPAAAYGELRRHCDGRLVVVECVVDRICAWHPGGKRDEHSRRMVQHHPVGEWIVPLVAPVPPWLAALERAPLVERCEPPLDGWKARKLWAVNGVHIVLALVARLNDFDKLPLAGEAQARFVELARPLTERMAAAVHARWPEVPLDEEYVSARIRAFCESPDTAERIIGRYLVRRDLRAFMVRLEQRLVEAARQAHEAGLDCQPFADAIAFVVLALSDPRIYFEEPGADRPLSREIDEQVVHRFEAMLDEWLDPQVAQGHVSALRRALRSHRGNVAPVRR